MGLYFNNSFPYEIWKRTLEQGCAFGTFPFKKGFHQTPIPTFSLGRMFPTLEEEDFFLVFEFPGRVWIVVYPSLRGLLALFLFIMYFLPGWNACVYSFSQRGYFIAQVRAKGFFSLTSSKSPGQAVSFSLQDSCHYLGQHFQVRYFSCGCKVRGQTQHRVH